MPPGSRKRLSIGEKREVIEKLIRTGCSHGLIAAEYHISLRSISRMIQNQDSIMNTTVHPTKKLITMKVKEMDQRIYSTFVKLRRFGFPVTNELLEDIGQLHATLLNHQNFSASHAWLMRITSDYNIKKFLINTVDSQPSDPTIEHTRLHLENAIFSSRFPLENIFNMDETAFMYEYIPDKMLDLQFPNGIKASRVRITLVACCNATGSVKHPLLFIGKVGSNFPLGPDDSEYLRTQYLHHKAAWMNSDTFNKWLIDFDKKRDAPTLLILKDASIHKIAEGTVLSKTRLIFIPSKMGPDLLPLDAGIMDAFKSNYRDQLTKKMEIYTQQVEEMKLSSEEMKKIKATSFATSMTLMNQIWSTLDSQTIKKCWKECMNLPEEKRPATSHPQRFSAASELSRSNDHVHGLGTLANVAFESSVDDSQRHLMGIRPERQPQIRKNNPTKDRKHSMRSAFNSSQPSEVDILEQEVGSTLTELQHNIRPNTNTNAPSIETDASIILHPPSLSPPPSKRSSQKTIIQMNINGGK
eukprot:TRINITY_DN10678_c0_g1_i1.p1 TRINITY_DN10678_c0_g1~~TRINITY_DN10678_c0_g1_i1.p1  ORF type:complete len:526 (+),score=94.63 TRINITY_DN10678_c0_g1_i1:73-1650(+)